jgi:phage terminase, small subunit
MQGFMQIEETVGIKNRRGRGGSNLYEAFPFGTGVGSYAQIFVFKRGIKEKRERRGRMAKDGTNRGGARQGTGPKKKPLVEKISNGTVKGTMVLSSDLPEPIDIQGENIPQVREYLKAKQKNGNELCAEEIYRETYLWLKQRSCEMLVNNQLIEQYAMSVARWIQCEEAISEFGYLAKHPTTGNAIASPYVSMSRDYKKQVNADWFQIYQIVRENCAVEFEGISPQDDVMERLLRARNRK